MGVSSGTDDDVQLRIVPLSSLSAVRSLAVVLNQAKVSLKAFVRLGQELK